MDRRRAAVAERRVRALELRTQGFSLRAIARELKLSGPQAASNLVEGALNDIQSPAVAQYRKEVDERARLMLEQLMPVVVNKRASRDDRLNAIDRVIRIDRELRQLHGLDAPATTVQVTAEVGTADVRQKLLDRLAALAESAAARADHPEP